MSYPPSVSDFQAQFPSNRYFIYGEGPNTVTTNDVQNAINLAGIDFNPSLWDSVTPVGSSTEAGIAYCYLAAHYLVLNVQGAGGLSSIPMGRAIRNQGQAVIESKSVGGVSISQALLNLAKENPIYAPLLQTTFGQVYLKLVFPRTVGNVAVVSGSGGIAVLNTNVPAPLQITTTSLPSGTHSVAYSQTLQATGGVGVYQWAVVSGSLPTGLSLGALSGTISGTPSVAASYYFEVRLTDNLNNTTLMNYQVVIA